MFTVNHRIVSIFFLVAILFLPDIPFAQSNHQIKGLTPRVTADYIHAVIQADRRIYSHYIVDRLAKKIDLKATENWEEENTLLLPAQFLLKSSQLANESGIGLRYHLMSLWPINPANAPQSEEQKLGLREVVKDASRPFTWIVKSGDIWYYQAIYPDVADSDSCVQCHNRHPQSPKTDFKRGDVMGGILVNLPIGKHVKKPDVKQHLFTPAVVSDYVHAILESDRRVYSQYIVDRLQSKNIVHATEQWQSEDGLLLPAQFLLNASQLVAKRNVGVDFRLISLWPINPRNHPANDFERKGLEIVDIHPVRPYTGQFREGKKRIYQSVYPDFAVTKGCIQCHNAHPNSPKNDFRIKEVMGGIVVTLNLKNDRQP